MTPDKTPTPDELKAFRDAFDWDGWTDPKAAQRAFGLAVLAKWGSPVVAVEPIGYTHSSWMAEAKRGRNGVFVANQMIGFDRPLYTAPQPTHAQAGAVPLTAFIPVQRERLFYNRPENVGKGLAMADWHRIVQYIESAKGIKGGQHG